jgi:cell filamentation protein
MADPYVYVGADILINKENIRDRAELEIFERVMTANRLEALPRGFPLTANGYRQFHRYIFQDVYAWAGKYRTVNLAKGGHIFCLVPHIRAQMERQFTVLQAEKGLKGLTRQGFTERAAEQVCEINAIHPFREGNGRKLRAFLERLAAHAGWPIDLARIGSRAWNSASIVSFRRADYNGMREVILRALVQTTPG